MASYRSNNSFPFMPSQVKTLESFPRVWISLDLSSSLSTNDLKMIIYYLLFSIKTLTEPHGYHILPSFTF